MSLSEMTPAQLNETLQNLQAEYKAYCDKNLKLDMSRGKPSPEQLDITVDMHTMLRSIEDFKTENNTDTRNYGLLEGIAEARVLMGDLLGAPAAQTIVGGNSSLNLMYDALTLAMTHGVAGGAKPWGRQQTLKFICPVPGYDRHFRITEFYGIEMVNVPLLADGPDMDRVEELVKDPTVKGMWCVPKYSNPTGITYSDAVVRRIAALKPAADDFRIFWDNAYCVHDLDTEKPDSLLNILTACAEAGNPDMVYVFGSTSKISFSGAGIAAMAASEANINLLKKQFGVKTIGYDKINQLLHVKYYKNLDGIRAKMAEHAAIMRPKFEVVDRVLTEEVSDIATWSKPNGGYFISLDTPRGCAKRTLELCKEAGVTMTPAGATFPYGKDPDDTNIRIAPSYPGVEELELAAKLLCLSLKIAAIEKML